MTLLFVHDHRFGVTDDGVYSNQFTSDVLRRYLRVFGSMIVVGRSTPMTPDLMKRVPRIDSANVRFQLQPNISTPASFLGTRAYVARHLQTLIAESTAVLVRLPSELGLLAASTARQMGRTYGVELAGCASDALRFHGAPLARLYAPLQRRRTQAAVYGAQMVSYVTQSYLQGAYPAHPAAMVVALSNVAVATPEIRPDHPDRNRLPMTIGMIGSLKTRYKGADTAIEALAQLRAKGVDARLRILGAGNPESYADLAQRHDVTAEVVFDGTLPAGPAVRDWLDRLTIYIQPSLTEGLPRALIEAMSRGLPAVASNVGGIPELLPADALVPPGDASALACALERLVSDRRLAERAAQANFATAQRYDSAVLEHRRREFLTQLRDSHRRRSDAA